MFRSLLETCVVEKSSKHSPAQNLMDIPATCEVLIIGGGVAGASAAYYLAQSGVKDVVVLECGRVGNGRMDPVRNGQAQDAGCGESGAETILPYAQRSGSAVMPSASTIKMIVRLYASSSEDFISHHGTDGAQKYLGLATLGLKKEKELANQFLPDKDTQVRSRGSLYLAYENDFKDFHHEYETLRSLGCDDIEWWEKDKLSTIPGCSEAFHYAIYFPGDAIINSGVYAGALLSAAQALGGVRLFEDCSPVVNTATKLSSVGGADGLVAETVLQDGTRIQSKHVVLATGGLFTGDTTLSGILRPCWSYLVSLPHPDAQQLQGRDDSALLPDGTPKFSYNFFTWGFTHDWCWTEGAVRISGEDHYSALKAPRAAERCQSLANWTRQAYPKVFGESAPVPVDSAAASDATAATGACAYNWQYGVYSETPDAVPIVGQTGPSSRVCYLLGCNAWGQAVLSYCATLVPALLGYRKLTAEEQAYFSLLTVQRFALIPAVLSDAK